MLLYMSLIRSSSARSLDSVTSVIAEHPAGQDPVPEGGRLSIRKRIANLFRGWFQPRNRQETEERDARSVSYDSDESRDALDRLADFNGMEEGSIAGGEPTPGSSDEIDAAPLIVILIDDSSDENDEEWELIPSEEQSVARLNVPEIADSSDENDEERELIPSEEQSVARLNVPEIANSSDENDAGWEAMPDSSDENDAGWEPMPDSSDEIDEGREPMPDSLDEIDEEWEPMSDSSDEIDDGWELIPSEEQSVAPLIVIQIAVDEPAPIALESSPLATRGIMGLPGTTCVVGLKEDVVSSEIKITN